MTAVRTGRHVAIVSNNSHAAITPYLENHKLTSHVKLVVGRAYAQPVLMKPHTHSVTTALGGLGVSVSASVLIGDSPSDMEAARAARVHAVGFAKDPQRARSLYETQADLVIDSMEALAEALAAT